MVARLAMQITEAIESGIAQPGRQPCVSAAVPVSQGPAMLMPVDEAPIAAPYDMPKSEIRTRPKRPCLRRRMGYAASETALGKSESDDLNAHPDAGLQIARDGNPCGLPLDISGAEQNAALDVGASTSSDDNPKPNCQRNGIFSPPHEVIWLTHGGRRVFEENDFRKNLNGVWETSPDATFK
jgi:hypothetical protein